MTLIKHIYGQLANTPNQEPSAPHAHFVSNNKFGIELELENVPSEIWETSFRYWTVVEESSLRQSGAELILSRPLNGDALFRAVGEAFNHRLVQDSDPSWRCGIHMHIDVRSWSVEKLAAFAMYYVAEEQKIFERFGEDRVFSNFCVPLSFQPRVLRSVLGGALGNLHESCKYSAINFRPMTSLGSIEWRAGSASTNASVMREIIKTFCVLIKKAEDFVAAENKGELIRELFPDDEMYHAVIYFRKTLQANIATYAHRHNPARAESVRRQNELLSRIRLVQQESEEYENDEEEDYENDDDDDYERDEPSDLF